MSERFLCERCGGTGWQGRSLWGGAAYDSVAGICTDCDGTGQLGQMPENQSGEVEIMTSKEISEMAHPDNPWVDQRYYGDLLVRMSDKALAKVFRALIRCRGEIIGCHEDEDCRQQANLRIRLPHCSVKAKFEELSNHLLEDADKIVGS